MFLLGTLTTMIKSDLALVLVSTVFGLAHSKMASKRPLIHMVAFTLLVHGSLGILLGTVFLLTGSLLISSLLHASINVVFRVSVDALAFYGKSPIEADS